MKNYLVQASADYKRIEKAITYVEQNFKDQPSLETIAANVGLSKFHFQRLFKEWAGISPTQFLHFLTVTYAKERLAESHSILDASYDAGLSSPSRLHDLFINFDAITPGDYKREGAGLEIRYGFHDTPFGRVLIATTERGICGLHFVADSEEETLEHLQQDWSLATLIKDSEHTAPIIQHLFTSTASTKPASARPFHLFLKGTNFQVQVWQALIAIPEGSLMSYQDVASLMNKPSATRAVASAIAKNPVGYIIPCHRVISQAGKLHQYRWGAARKKAIVGWEASQRLAEAA